MPIVKMPSCEICGTLDSVYPCAWCGKLVCKECTQIISPDKCIHRKLEITASNPNWIINDNQ